MKTSELTGAELDYWAGKADSDEKEFVIAGSVCMMRTGAMTAEIYSPSTDWSQGGPIIERERIETCFDHELYNEGPEEHAMYLWEAWHMDTSNKTHYEATSQHGPTLLIAAMRCFVASVYGPEVPDET